jgi:hypothetical protein
MIAFVAKCKWEHSKQRSAVSQREEEYLYFVLIAEGFTSEVEDR